MKQVYLLRHGESEAQVHSRVTSEYSRTRDPALKDCALTRRGVDQAKRAGSSLVEYLDTSIDGEPLDLIVVSPLTRALQTALLMCKGARGELDDVPIIVLPAIAEAGNIMENHRRTADELRCDRKLTMFPRFESFDFSLLDAADRAIAAFGSSYSPHDEKGAKTRAVRHYLGACGARNIAVIGHYCRFIELVQPHVHVTHFTNCKIVTCRCCPICGMLFPRTNRDGSVGDETHVCQRAPAVGSSSPSASSGSGSGGSGTSTTSASGSRPPTVQRQLSDDATALFSAALSGMTPADRNLLMRVRSERDIHEKAINAIGNGVRGKKAKKARMRHAQRVATLKRTPRYAAALAAAKAAGAPQPPAAAAAAAVRSSLSELTCGTASRSGLVLHLESSDAASAAAAWRAPVAALQAHLPDGGAISPLHITLLGASAVKTFGRDRLRAALAAAPAAGLPAPPRLKFDGVARVARRGGRRTAFLRLASQDKWSTYVDRLLSALRECSADGEESSSVSDGEARLFHVSCWNNDHGGSYQSVGNIDRSDDSRGVNFIQLFGALKFNSASSGGILRNGEVGSEDEDSAAADAVAAAAAAEAPEAMVLTREELRRGNTCRRPAPGSSAECQAKFPRTFHIHDLGGMTGDDLLLDDSEKARFLNGVNIVTVEEKIDGANLGVSLSPDMRGASGRPAFRFQKRAHYITSASEPQYAGLDHWAAQNQRALRQLLRRPLTRGGPRAQPGQRTVFGEWCARTHTKKYDQLPSKFVAFDVWDASLRCGRGGFVTAATRNALLHSLRGVDGYGSRLFRIRCIARRTFTRVEEIVSLLCDSEEALSVYASMSGSSSSASVGGGAGASIAAGSSAGDDHLDAECRVEGLYLRIDGEDGVLVARCKIVHGSFHQHLAGGRWERQVVHNIVRRDVWEGLTDDGEEVS